jgi:hypothetical protein
MDDMAPYSFHFISFVGILIIVKGLSIACKREVCFLVTNQGVKQFGINDDMEIEILVAFVVDDVTQTARFFVPRTEYIV